MSTTIEDTPVNTTVNTPVDTTVDTPADTLVDTPVDTPADPSCFNTTADSPAETLVDTTADSPEDIEEEEERREAKLCKYACVFTGNAFTAFAGFFILHYLPAYHSIDDPVYTKVVYIVSYVMLSVGVLSILLLIVTCVKLCRLDSVPDVVPAPEIQADGQEVPPMPLGYIKYTKYDNDGLN